MDLVSIALQCAAVVLCLGGTWNTGNRHLVGPVMSALGAGVFVVLNTYSGLWIVAGLSALSMLVSVRNVIKWSRL